MNFFINISLNVNMAPIISRRPSDNTLKNNVHHVHIFLSLYPYNPYKYQDI